MKITVIGTGYVGLVTGACFANVGNQVICADINQDKIDMLNQNKNPIYEPGLLKVINSATANHSISFTCNIKDAIEKSDIIFIAVGTPMNDDGSSNLEYIYGAAKDIGQYINKDKIIITKSTIPVGTTLKIKEIIETEIKHRKEDINFDIANNPEFLKEGKAVNDFNSPDRIIIGLENQKLKSVFRDLYKPFSINHEKLIFMDIPSSELTKYVANAMLATKISFINEMAIIAENVGADINMVRNGIGSDQRIGYSFIYPSVGYGGSCFPKDIKSLMYFSENKGYVSKILGAVDTVNTQQKKYFFEKIKQRFKNIENMQFGIWGLSFKPGTDDMRESASIYIVRQLIKLGASVKVYDPKSMDNAKNNYFSDFENIEYCDDKYNVLNNSEALILLTEWPEFRSPDFKILKNKLNNPILFDGRNQFDANMMQELGFEYYQIGKNKI